ncbi:hypothetical protein PybrP1_005109 [[Pythium] brassicae (nom. inval.)]|nr:hypothetical protein PybrP1_005109 [[Pythium] brassicae (nom. inval.)]
MVLNMFTRKDPSVSDESKHFVNSLPSTFVNVFRKRRQLLPVWSSNKYCAMIKSTFLVYYRVSRSEDAANHASERVLKYLNLQNCSIRMIDDDSAGFVFCVTPESGRGALFFAADTEKDRAKFAAQAAAVQRHALSVSDFETLKLLGKGHYGRVILARGVADKQLYAVKEMKLSQVKPKVVYTERSVMEWAADHPFILGLDFAFARGKSVFLVSRFMPGGDLFLHMQNHGGCFHEDVRLESRHGRTKTMCGTDTYLPPEMVGRYPAGHGLPVDMWQFGCILFELRAGYPPFYIPQSSQKSTHQRILYQTVRYPNNLSKDFKNLLVALLEKKQEDRLGFHSGVAEVKQHPFFNGVDWEKVLKKQLPPPLVPGPAGDTLVNNFDPQFTEQPHQIYVSEELVSCYERDFAGYDFVRQRPVPATREQRPAGAASSSSSTKVTEEDDKPELEPERINIKI